jgi:orotate phosphoribosyltransferase
MHAPLWESCALRFEELVSLPPEDEMSTTLAAEPAVRNDLASRDLDSLLERFRDLVQEESILVAAPGESDFVLASGRHSRYYCDTKKVMLSPEGAQLTGEILFIVCEGQAEVEAIGGLQLGAAFIATAVALVSGQHGHPIYGFTVRQEKKQHGNKERVAQSFHPDGQKLLCCGRRVVVVDDVVTQGDSILEAVKEVEARQCEIVAVVALVDRNEGGGDRLRELGLPYFPLLNASEPGTLTINADLLSRPRVHRIAPG